MGEGSSSSSSTTRSTTGDCGLQIGSEVWELRILSIKTNIHTLASQYTQISIIKNSNHNYTCLSTNSYTYSLFYGHKGHGKHEDKLVEGDNGEDDCESGEAERIASKGQHMVLKGDHAPSEGN